MKIITKVALLICLSVAGCGGTNDFEAGHREPVYHPSPASHDPTRSEPPAPEADPNPAMPPVAVPDSSVVGPLDGMRPLLIACDKSCKPQPNIGCWECCYFRCLCDHGDVDSCDESHAAMVGRCRGDAMDRCPSLRTGPSAPKVSPIKRGIPNS